MIIGGKIHNLLHPKLGKTLMLHRVVDCIGPQPEARNLELTVDSFTHMLEALKSKGADFIGIGEVAQRLLSRKHGFFVCVTFDDGYLDTFELAYPILKERHIPFCVYATRDFYQGKSKPHWNPEVAMMAGRQLVALSSDPLCTIGAHTSSHPHLSQLSEEDQRREIEGSKIDLEQLLGKPVCHFAYPHGDYDERTLHLMKELGFETAVTTSGRHVRSDSKLLELDRVFV